MYMHMYMFICMSLHIHMYAYIYIYIIYSRVSVCRGVQRDLDQHVEGGQLRFRLPSRRPQAQSGGRFHLQALNPEP